jgi:outer membrane receptor protein involved in Fe transport
MDIKRIGALRPLALAVWVALVAPGAALAQQADEPKEDKKSAVDLERIVVTATPSTGVSTMRSSVSVSTTTVEQIQASQAQSAAEALRSIPGVRSESSGGEGNANITVRGVPISAGGARYVQLQENGLPVILFGDIAFATSDMFVRVDNSLDQLQVVRGGSASTAATNSPGGVINFMTKTGVDKGGAVGLSFGLGFDQQRIDLDYGSGLMANGSSYHVGGHFRQGKGAHPSDVKGENGGQIQASYSQNFGAGSFRIYGKFLDDSTPTLLPVPVKVVGGKIFELPGIDPRKYTPYGSNWPADPVLNKDNSISPTNINDGLTVRNTAVGGELAFNLGGGWKLEDRIRLSEISGRFTGIFPRGDLEQGTFTIQSGPQKGQKWTGTAAGVAAFNTAIDDLGSISNDLKVTKRFDLADKARVDFTGGLFYNQQNVSLTWHFNHYLIQLVDKNPALVGSAKVPTGLISFGAADWGFCCQRAIDAEYTTVAPYAAFAYEAGPLNFDASIRLDKQNASGTFNQAATKVIGKDKDGKDISVLDKYVSANAHKIDYSVDHTSFSLGGNYRITRDLSAFARYSDGVAFNADRIMFGSQELNGRDPIKVNTLKQAEVGVKFREGNFSAFVTLFNARTAETNYEATTQISTTNSYRANGLELEAAYSAGAFRLGGGATFTNAEITASNDKATIGKTPRRQAKVVYQLSPSYSFGPVNVGASIIGTGKSWGDDGNTITMGGYTVVNAFVNFEAMKNLTIGVGVNNLANTIGYTEIEGDGHAARSINGRTVKASLKYSF